MDDWYSRAAMGMDIPIYPGVLLQYDCPIWNLKNNLFKQQSLQICISSWIQYQVLGIIKASSI